MARYLKHHNRQHISSTRIIDLFFDDITANYPPANGDVMFRRSGSWVNISLSQLQAELDAVPTISYVDEIIEEV